MCLSLPLSTAALAQTPEGAGVSARYLDPISGLTVDDAIAQAVAHEPGLQGVATDVEVAQGERSQAALKPNPSASFAHQQEPGGTDSQTRVELQWPLDIGRRSARVHAADAAVDRSRLSLSARQRDLAGLIRQRFGEAAAAIQDVVVSGAALSTAIDQQRLVTARVDQGAAPAVERNIIDVEVEQLRAAQLSATGRADRALIGLKRLVGLAPDAPLKLRASLEDLVAGAAVAMPTPTESRADVAEAQSQVAAADAEIARARTEARPDVSLSAMYMRMDAGFPQLGFSAAGALERVRGVFHYVSAGATVTLPVLSRNQGTIAVAEAMKRKAQSGLAATRATAAAEMAVARIRDQQARAALDVLGPARTLVRQNVTVMQQSYQLGRATLLDVLEQQRRFVEFERQYTTALSEAFNAREELLQVTGGVQ
jgi:cobalt-zinc-cadmium efflux system outer membrane protein